MKKKIVFGVCILCIGTVLTELVALGVLAVQGKLNRKTIGEVQAVLDGEYREPAIEAEAEVRVPRSQSEIDRERIDRSYRLDNRRTEIEKISDLLLKRGDKLQTDQLAIQAMRENFNSQLDALKKSLAAESIETARGILIKMTSDDAVSSLMPSPLQHNIQLLKGMQEKKIAEILQQFMKSQDPKIVKRGQDIFQAISVGEPEKTLVETAIKQGKPDFNYCP